MAAISEARSERKAGGNSQHAPAAQQPSSGSVAAGGPAATTSPAFTLAQSAGYAAIGVLAGVALGVAAGLGVSQLYLVVGLITPFIILVTLARPQWVVPIYAVLVYGDLLSIFIRYQGMPPVAKFVGAGMAAAVIGYRLIIRRQGLVDDKMTWWMLAYGGVVALGLLYARDTSLVANNLVEFVRNFLTYLIIVNTLTTTGRLRRTLWGILALGTFLSILTIYQTATGQTGNNFGGLAQYNFSEIALGQDGARPGGTYGDPNFYGQSLVFLVPWGFYLLFEGRKRLERLAGLASSGIIMVAVILTYSRGDALALAGVCVAAVIYKRPRPVYLVAGAVAVAIALPLLPGNYIARMSTVLSVAQGDQYTLMTEDSIRGRAGATQAAIAMFFDHPILGVGRENYPLYELQYLAGTPLAKYAKGIPPHDLYLEIAAEHGIVGLLVVGGLLVFTLFAVWEARKRFQAAGDPRNSKLSIWLGIGFLGYLISSIFLHGAFPHLLWLQVALIISARQVARSVAPVTARASLPVWQVSEVEPEIRVDMSQGLAITAPLPDIDKSLLTRRLEPGSGEVGDLFRAFWVANGGVSLFGVPVSKVLAETTVEGELAEVQYFERARFEHYPDRPGEVALGKLGTEVHASGLVASPLPKGLQGEQVELRTTGIHTPLAFYNFWQQYGGPGVFGYPLTPVLLDTGRQGEQVAVQYFERVRLEWHPRAAGKDEQIRLSDLGTQVFRQRYGGKQLSKKEI